MIPTLLLATLVVFLLQRLIPGSPEAAIAGEYATPERLAEIRVELGLDRPLYTQYLDWVFGAFTGDLGTSLHSNSAVLPVIMDRLPITLLLTTFALLVAIVIGLPAGVWAASRQGTKTDQIMTSLATLGLAVPSFWLGMMMILLFANQLQWLPGPGGVGLSEDPVAALKGLIMPSIALGVVGAAEICRQVRSAMIEDLSSDHVRTHHAKGLANRAVVWRHSLKNSSLPLATIIGLQVSRLIGSAVVVESVFGLAGIGTLVVDATNQRDYPLIQAVVFVAAILVLVTNLIVDVAYRIIDPRISA